MSSRGHETYCTVRESRGINSHAVHFLKLDDLFVFSKEIITQNIYIFKFVHGALIKLSQINISVNK